MSTAEYVLFLSIALLPPAILIARHDVKDETKYCRDKFFKQLGGALLMGLYLASFVVLVLHVIRMIMES
jgi:hypothetical protein